MLWIGIVLIIVGSFFIITPETVWELRHALTVRNGEPTRFALIWIRVVGVVFILAGLVAAAAFFIEFRA